MGLYLDDLHRQVTNPHTPPDERADINQLMLREFISGLDFPNMDDARTAIGEVLDTPALMAKATRLEPYTQYLGAVDRTDGRGRKGHSSVLYINEFGVVQGQGPGSRWIEKPIGGGFGFLRDFVASVDVIKAIILTRQRQILSFCEPESDDNPLGWRLVRKDGEKLTKDDKKEVARLEQFLWNCGDEFDARKRKRLRRDDFPGFISKLIWDTLSADACPIETEMTSGGKLSGWYSVPYDTVRLCLEDGYEGDDEIFAVQVIQDSPYVTYGYDDLIYEIRNPRTDLQVNGYGYAETEMIVRAITAYLNSFEYNASGLSKNSFPRGMMLIFGEYAAREMNAFKSQWQAMMHGPSNAHVLPIMAAKSGKEAGAQFVPIDTNFNEMLFAKFITLTVSVPCAIYGIDPNEIHFDSFSSHQSSPLSGKDTREKLAHSRDKGLIPLLTFPKRIINTYMLPQVTPKYMLKWAGVNEEDQALKAKRIELSSTTDELRDMDGKDPYPDPVIGGAPAGNAALMSAYMAQHGLGGGGQETPSDEDDNGGDRGDKAKSQSSDSRQRATDREPTYGKSGGRRRSSERMAKAQRVDDFMVIIDHR